MNFLKMSLSNAILFFGAAIFFMASSCEKTDIAVDKTQEVQFEYFDKLQKVNTASSASVEDSTPLSSDAAVESDELIYLEIPEEYQASPDEEMTVITETGPFYTEDGEEVEGTVLLEVAFDGDQISAIGVTQNLLDLGLINPDLGSFYKPRSEYYSECMASRCSPPPANITLQACHGQCNLQSWIHWIFQVGETN